MAKKKKKSSKNKTKSSTKTKSSVTSSKNTKPAPLFDGLDNGKRILIITISIIAWFFIGICLIFVNNKKEVGFGMAIAGAIYIISVGSTCSAYINGTYEGDIDSLRNIVATTQASSFGVIGACLYLLYAEYTKLEFTFDSLLGNRLLDIFISLLKWIGLGVYISMMIIVLWI
jgi:hypothetical protein